jgi:hypothetical protein
MAGIAIRADVAGNGSRLRRIGRNADTPGIGASLTVLWYVVIAIIAIVAIAVVVVIRLFQRAEGLWL